MGLRAELSSVKWLGSKPESAWGTRAAMLSLRAAVRTRRIRSVLAKLVVLGGVALVLGFLTFLLLLPDEVVLEHNADGIVVLTGGTSRVTEALELLAAGRGKRLLISGVNPGTTIADIAHQVAGYEPAAELLRRPRLFRDQTLGNAVETRRWATDRGFHSLIVVTSAYHMPRALAEIAHQLPDVDAHSVSGRIRPAACRAVVVERRHHPAGAVGIFQISVRQGAHAFRHRWRRRPADIRLADARPPIPPHTDPGLDFVILLSPSSALACSSTHCSIVNMIVRMIVALPTIVLPLSVHARHPARLCAQQSLAVAGDLRHQGRMARPRKAAAGAYIVACKHQSVWETFALFALLADPAYVLKRELMWIPLFGWLATKAGMIPVDRSARVSALARMTAAGAQGDRRVRARS